MGQYSQKKEELGTPLLAALYLSLQGVVSLTMGSVYHLLGIPKEKRTLHHAEIFLVSTTLILITLITVSQYWRSFGWVAIVFGNIRLLQIVSLNLITFVFDFTPIGDSVERLKRARWHFVAIAFSFLDAVLIFAFMYEFFDARFQILNKHSYHFVDYAYYSLVTMATLGYGDITPVQPFGKLLAMYEIIFSLMLIVFFVAGAVGRLQQKH